MSSAPKGVAIGIIGLFVAGCSGNGTSIATAPVAITAAQAVGGHVLARPLGERSLYASTTGALTHLCAASNDALHASCLSSVRMATSLAATSSSVGGLTPSDLNAIYGVTSPFANAQTGATIGIVVAYDNSEVEGDLAAYRSSYGLPVCSSANGCFQKVGGAAAATIATAGAPTSISAHPTSTTSGWAAEADADTQAVSAICPSCKIVLAEAASDSMSDLASAVGAATNAGAVVVDASFGAPESTQQLPFEAAFEPAPVKVVAAAGDSGPQVLFPAAATNVVSVAGTSISNVGLVVTETLWSASGGGCSQIFARPSFQPSWCGKHSVADLAVVADPSDGISFYDAALGGWGVIGGTSIGAPIVASMLAMSGDAKSGAGSSQLYAHALFHYAHVLQGGTIAGNGAPLGLSAF